MADEPVDREFGALFEQGFQDEPEEAPKPPEDEPDEAAEPEDDDEPADAPEGDSDAPEDEDEPEGDDEDEPPGEAAAVKKKKPKEKPPEPPRVHKVKVDGAELEVDDEELVRGYSTGRAASQRFQEAKRLHAEAESFYQAYLTNPGEALVSEVVRRSGVTRTQAREKVRDVFLEFLGPDLEESLIQDPEKRQLYRDRRQIADERTELERRQAEQRRRDDEAANETLVKTLRTAIGEGIKKHALPNANEIWSRVGGLLDAAQRAGTRRENLPELVPALVAQVAQERSEEAKRLVSTLSAAELKKLFPEATEKLKEERIQAVTEKRAQKVEGAAGKAKKPKTPKFISTRDAFG